MILNRERINIIKVLIMFLKVWNFWFIDEKFCSTLFFFSVAIPIFIPIQFCSVLFVVLFCSVLLSSALLCSPVLCSALFCSVLVDIGFVVSVYCCPSLSVAPNQNNSNIFWSAKEFCATSVTLVSPGLVELIPLLFNPVISFKSSGLFNLVEVCPSTYSIQWPICHDWQIKVYGKPHIVH